jgi:hypothetical protein
VAKAPGHSQHEADGAGSRRGARASSAAPARWPRAFGPQRRWGLGRRSPRLVARELLGAPGLPRLECHQPEDPPPRFGPGPPHAPRASTGRRQGVHGPQATGGPESEERQPPSRLPVARLQRRHRRRPLAREESGHWRCTASCLGRASRRLPPSRGGPAGAASSPPALAAALRHCALHGDAERRAARPPARGRGPLRPRDPRPPELGARDHQGRARRCHPHRGRSRPLAESSAGGLGERARLPRARPDDVPPGPGPGRYSPQSARPGGHRPLLGTSRSVRSRPSDVAQSAR